MIEKKPSSKLVKIYDFIAQFIVACLIISSALLGLCAIAGAILGFLLIINGITEVTIHA